MDNFDPVIAVVIAVAVDNVAVAVAVEDEVILKTKTQKNCNTVERLTPETFEPWTCKILIDLKKHH